MRSNKYYTSGDLYYSAIYGGGIYEWTGEMVQDPVGGERGEEAVSPLLSHVLTGEQFFLKRIPDGSRSRYRNMILSPPRNGQILWPGDLIRLEEEQRGACTLFVTQEYVPVPSPARERSGADALLFPYGGYPGMVDGARKLSQIGKPSWKVQEVRDMAVEIVRALESVNRSGYIYADLHLSRLHFMDTGKVFLDFSNLIFSVRNDGEAACPAKAGCYPIEFADPAVIQGRISRADFHSQNYGLCALLFYLFFGRYACDGPLLTDWPDNDIQQHYVKFRNYHQMPVFIFDPEDRRNGLGEFEDEKPVIALWEELPECLKTILIQTLRKGNAERTGQVNNPTPSTWLRCFKELGWCGEKGETGA